MNTYRRSTDSPQPSLEATRYFCSRRTSRPPHKIRCTISSSFGAAIRFDEFSAKWDIEVSFTSNKITEEVLPRLSNTGVP